MTRYSIKMFLLIPITIGILSGLAAVLFETLIHYTAELFLVQGVGYIKPLPASEGIHNANYIFSMTQPWMLPVSTFLGGLLVGIIIYRFSPRSAGVGTDAAIKAYHQNDARLNIKDAILKLFTSAITIGSGGTSGKEGPIAFVGAGIGSFVSQIFKLTYKERRIAYAIGLGSGIAAIFRAPFAGAIIATEIFYSEDFVAEALVPGIIASIVSFSVYGYFINFQSIFATHIPGFINLTLIDFAIYISFGILCALVARALVFTFRITGRFFEMLDIPPWIKPAIGGLIVGLIGMYNPIVIGGGYGWIQLIMDGNTTTVSLPMVLSAIPLMILAVSFSIGSGGSGGLFGPSLVIGGLVGAAFFTGVNMLLPHEHLSLQSLVVVGMILVFGGATKAPLSTIVLVSEMTHGYELLVPTLISIFVTLFLSGDKGIFPSQIKNRYSSVNDPTNPSLYN